MMTPIYKNEDDTRIEVYAFKDGGYGEIMLSGVLRYPSMAESLNVGMIVLEFDDVPENRRWAGRCYGNKDRVHGEFAKSEDCPFSEKLFVGNIQIEGYRMPLKLFFPGLSSLHIADDVEPTEAQRMLLMRACYLRGHGFMAGASIAKFIKPQEVEKMNGEMGWRSA